MSSYPHAAKRQTIPAAVALPIVDRYCARLQPGPELDAGLQRRDALRRQIQREYMASYRKKQAVKTWTA